MATQFNYAAEIHGSVEAIAAAYRAEEYWQERIRTIGTPEDSLDAFAAGSEWAEVTVTHVIPDKDIPAAARKIVAGQFAVVRTTRYELDANGRLTGHAHAEALGGLGIIDGAGEVLPGDGAVSTEQVAGSIRVAVPLLGRKLEGMVHDYLDRLFASEYRFLNQYVSRG